MLLFGEEFYFARHGETSYNALEIVTGKCNITLNETGEKQALEASEIIKKLAILSCLCSPLCRAADTARLMLSQTNIVPVPVDGLEERHWGELEGTSKHELDKHSFPDRGVESWQCFINRTVTALQSIEFTLPTLVVAHSGTYRALCDYLKINIEKKPVRNAWPYRFFNKNGSWHVEECRENS